MCTVPTHYLKQLSDEASWLLFTKHVFENRSASGQANLEVIGKKIVEKCKGLPLAVKTLGGLLRSRLDAKEWNDMFESKIWDLPNEKSHILPALRLSYHYLPTHLKQCFAYCSIFPKDYKFQREKLVLLWMAEGFVQPQKSKKRMEEVGDEYFRELLSRSFFQQLGGDKASFVKHDLINDLAQFVSGEFCYRLEDNNSHDISRKVRHFSYSRGQHTTYDVEMIIKCDTDVKFGHLYEIKGLRTFLPLHPPSLPLNRVRGPTIFCLSKKVPYDLLPTLTCLRVLSLSHYENITELPNSIANLKQLRYLDMSRTAIKRLPEVICTLYHLQTLMLSDCHSLTNLPTGIGRLTNLRPLDISGTNLTEMPVQMGGLKSLQTLTTFIVGKYNVGLRVRELREFRHLRGTLSILKLQNVVDSMDAMEANLKDMDYLDELLLEWGSNTDDSHNEKDILDKLQPSTNLKRLTIQYYGGTSFPNWLGDCSFFNITFLHLSDCIYCFSLPPLGQLPSLEELYIVGINSVKSVGLEFYGSGSSSIKPFRKLKILSFEFMPEWEEWSYFGVEGGIFPCLQVLYIQYCPNLKGDLPNHLPFLKEIVISDCQQLMVSIPRGVSLCKLKLHGCLEVVLNSVVDLTSSLQSLCISKFPNITCQPCDQIATSSTQVDQQLVKMPTILHYLTSLERLEIVGCTNLLSFPEKGLAPMLRFLRIDSCDALESLSMGMFRNCILLQYLTIVDCPSLKSFPSDGLPTTLKALHIVRCRRFELLLPEAQEMIHNYYASLESLKVHSSRDSLNSFPLGLFPKLAHLLLSDFMNLESLLIPERNHENLTSLSMLQIMSCPKLESFPIGGLPTPNLRFLSINNCKNLKSLPQRMHALLPSLSFLHIRGCPELEFFAQGGLPSKLITLYVSESKKLMACLMDCDLKKLVSLESFYISTFEGVESFPEEWLLPSTITTLSISSLPNLKCLDMRGLQHLTSLAKLLIWNCPELQSLPEEGLPNSLSSLSIWRTPLLTQRCQRENGEDWSKISHIPYILMDNELIS